MAETVTEPVKTPIRFSEPVDGKYHCEAVILSGLVLHNKKLGQFRIDLESLVYHKERLTVDYNHEPDDILGYAENFRVSEYGLVADVYLVETIAHVKELIDLIVAGTPFEMSPSINEEEGILETDNGIHIYKNVPMRGIAVCPFGTDRFTTLTLLKEETMSKKTDTQPTKLSDDSTKTDETKKQVKDPDLAEFIEVYGTEKGLELWQSNADIADIRKLKELIEKYGVPGKPELPADVPSTELNDTPHEPPKDGVDQEKTNLKASLTKLTETVTTLSGEITRLKAVASRGEPEPVSNGHNPPPDKKVTTNIARLAAHYAAKSKK
ncbi:MAG: hypothetical protein LBC20_03030 [Planctomycetaceae bacterium]|jgi:hypothetical protein|nr:hypothetical protein [Planctomycetaceae bacterium]